MKDKERFKDKEVPKMNLRYCRYIKELTDNLRKKYAECKNAKCEDHYIFRVNNKGNKITVKTRPSNPQSSISFHFLEKFLVPMPIYFRELIPGWKPQKDQFSSLLTSEAFDECIPDEFNGYLQ